METIKVRKSLFCLKTVMFTEKILLELVRRNALVPTKIAHIKITDF